MENSHMKKIILCVIAVIAIAIGIVVVAINMNGKETNIDNNVKNEVQQEMPQENNTEVKEPSSSKQVGI